MNKNSVFFTRPWLMLGLLASPAFAVDDVCVQQAYVDLPFFEQTRMPPMWWDDDFWNVDQELRWAEATEISNGRVVWDQISHTLFFELTVLGDNSRDIAADKIAIGLVSDMVTESYLYVEINPMSTCLVSGCPAPGEEVLAADVLYSQGTFSGTSYTWSALSPANPVADVAVIRPLIEINPAGGGLEDWTVRFGLQLPLDPVTQQLDQRLYLSLIHNQAGPTTGTIIEDVVLCESSSVTTNDCLLSNPVNGSVEPSNLPIFNVAGMWPQIVTGGIAFCP